MRRVRGWCGVIAGILLAVVVSAHASSFTLQKLLAHIAPADGTMERAYLQTRESSMLTESVTMEGTIRYRYPGYLHKSGSGTDGTRTVIIDGDTVHVERDGERTTVPLNRFRVLKTLMVLLDAMSQGNADRLRERFRVELEGSMEKWKLSLESRESIGNESDRTRQRQDTIELEIRGRDDEIRRIVLESSDSGRVTFEFQGEGN